LSVQLLIVDDHRLVREAIGRLLAGHSSIEIVGEASNGQEGVAEARRLKPDVVLMDIAMPLLNGVEAIRKVAADVPDAGVVALSMYGDRETVVSAIEAGAIGFVLKDSAPEQLEEAILAAARGQSYLVPDVSTEVVRSVRLGTLGEGEGRARSQLTGREREVLQLVAEGKTSKEIAGLLHISAKTVQNHRNHIMTKLDLHTVAELTRYAIEKGLLRPGT